MKHPDSVSDHFYGNHKEEQFWLDRLSGNITKSGFPYDFRTNEAERHLDRHSFSLIPRHSAALIRMSNGSDHQLHMLLTTAVVALLERYCNHSDIIVGTSIFNQDADGEFVNTALPLRNTIEPEMTFKDLVLHVANNMVEAAEHQNYPMETLLYHLNLPRSKTQFPLFDVAVLLENIQNRKFLKYLPINMVFSFIREGESVNCQVVFNAAIYKKATVSMIVQRLMRLIDEVIAHVNIPLSAINLLSERERIRVVDDFNRHEICDLPYATILDRFESQVCHSSGQTALVCGELSISYEALDRKSDQLARCLSDHGVKPGSVVGLLMDYSEELIPSVLAIIKTGGVYLPLDPEFPEDRIRFMLEDSNAVVVVSRQSILQGIQLPTRRLNIEETIHATDGESFLRPALTGDDPAYIIYTSGTSGAPKGVLISHGALANCVWGCVNKLEYWAGQRHVITAKIVFDACIHQMFVPLMAGGVIHIVSNEILNSPSRFVEFLNDCSIDVLDCVPSLLEILVENDWQDTLSKNHYDMILCGGDVLSEKLIGKIFDKFNVKKIVNLYGPTEATVNTTYFQIKAGNRPDNVPIGKPFPNYKVYVLDTYNNPVPIGVPGQLCVSGPGLAIGYLNQPEMTEQKFVRNPIDPNERMYLTGDRARWLPDGNIEFVGRTDHQVKVRGYRIDLAEIEHHLGKYAQVKNCAVIPFSDEDNPHNELRAFFVSERVLSSRELVDYLKGRLPDYMIPSVFIRLEEMPLKHTGKIDRQTLSKKTGEISSGEVYSPPETELEKEIAGIWQSLLNVDRVGICDNFFTLGGHSIKAISLLSQIAQHYGVHIPLAEFYAEPTITALSAGILNKKNNHKAAPSDNRLVLLKEGKDSASRLFFIHDGSGDVAVYRRIIDTLDPLIGYWGIKADKLDCDENTRTDLRAMAREYVDIIKSLQPEGPYRLAGFSLGGTLVYEMARQMEACGHELDLCIMIDAPVSLNGNGNGQWPKHVKNFLKPFLNGLTGGDNGFELRSLKAIRDEVQLIVDENEIESEMLLSFFPAEYQRIIPPELDPGEIVNQVFTGLGFDFVAEAYMPAGGIKVPITYFYAKDSDVDKDLWQRFSSGGIEYHGVNGGHFSMLEDGNINTVVKTLNTILNQQFAE